MTAYESVSPEGLKVRVDHRVNPYAYMLSGEQLNELLMSLGLRRAESIGRNHQAAEDRAPHGAYPNPCMGFVLMDATAGPWVPNDQAVLAAIIVGDGGDRFIPNAAAKAGGHRRLGRNYGEAVLVEPHLMSTGGFRYGHSAQVRGQIVGSSSQTTDQDLFEAAQLAADFVNAITDAHQTWKQLAGPGGWLSEDGGPGQESGAMVSWFLPL